MARACPAFFVEKGKRKNRQNPKRAVQNVFTSLAAFAAAAALVLCLVVCGELFEKPDTLRHAALMMTDLDNLKTINDTYGYDWGDNYLRQSRGPSTKRPPRSSPRWNARKPSGKKPGLKKQKISPSVLALCRYRGRFFVYLY